LSVLAFVSFLLGLGALGGTLAGTVGIGAGILLAPLLLYLPPLLGHAALDMRAVTGLTMVHALFATCAAAQIHHRRGTVCWPLVRWMGSLIAISSLSGALVSQHLPSADVALRGLFALMALAAVGLVAVPPRRLPTKAGAPESFSKSATAAIALGIGFVGGMVGQTAAVITMPLLIHVVRLPLRIAIGSGLAITFCAALGGSIGKQAAGQVDWALVLPLVIGSVLTTQVSARLSHRIQTKHLRRVLAVLIAAAALKVGHDAVVLGLMPHTDTPHALGTGALESHTADPPAITRPAISPCEPMSPVA
jgi:uncharacterized membrane protein YfcA